ncbi:hypothetical protein Pmar_PMAR022311 [Perkinsus marinus ATCC 50983]|uniref:Uncharacterized protein n=1 Tax=Perkinsus marinus (strain ATCC 50983 / TXsc) TaxID=423536 RepID=C5KDR3_PERM5|nr:hypothetical protein Pmar_PMAR022311 [Perkinsus marinus ATCC 50983]EER17366.1 hypothetical protein Pmar_PMAR022311 [Perkinsus marinus ATCC 50983]|eukprot:XP_002785570.1 hypothetical protein Pmar_PMAR022311 [Perkinsus marinus ATCC 50983]
MHNNSVLRERSFQGLLTKWLLVMPVRMVLPAMIIYTAAKGERRYENAFAMNDLLPITGTFAVHLVPRDLNITREKRMAKLKRSLRGLRQIHIHAAVNADHIDVYEDDAMREILLRVYDSAPDH